MSAKPLSILFGVTALLAGCDRRPAEKLRLLSGEGDSIDIGRELELSPAPYSWSFRANPGDVYRVRVDWPSGRVLIHVGSDLRDDRDDDDATQMQETEGIADGAHRTRAVLTVHPKANAAWIRLTPQGAGVKPMHVRIDREH
jgi:hypothetical protein